MVRTKGDRVPMKVGGKAPAKFNGNASSGKKSSSSSSSGGGSGGKAKAYTGGNPYHPRETPGWQKPITSFMNKSSTAKAADSDASSTSSKDDQHQAIEESAREIDDGTG